MKEKVLQYLEDKRFLELRELLKMGNPVDIAILMEEIPEKDLPLVFRILPKELASDTFVEMDVDTQELLIEAFSDKELKEVLEKLYIDDTVDIIEEMPAGVVKRILKQTHPDTRLKINEILKYPKDSAGSIMTIEYVDLNKDMTVKDAFSRIRQIGVAKETIYTCYVKDEYRRLIGLVTVKTLLLSDYHDTISDVMETNVIYGNTLSDKEEIAQTMSKYDLLALPIVDQEYRLVGIVTFDDAMDVIQEENTEDIEKMAAITPTDKPYMKTGVLETWKKRIPWLLLLMISATFTGKIIQYYEAELGAYVILTAFIPMLMDTGGNAGGQASVTIIRGLSLGDIVYKDVFHIVGKEIRVAFLCGITLSVGNFVKMIVVDGVGTEIAFIVCITLICTVLVAKTVGCILPMLAKMTGFDPAVMASPFITTIVDAVSLMIYFNIASKVLGL